MAGLKERLIQFVLRGKDELSPAAKQSEEALSKLREEAEQLGQALDQAKEAVGLAQSLAQVRRATEQAQRNLADAEKQVIDLRDALSKAPDAAGLEKSLRLAEREANRSRKQLSGLTVQLADAEKAAKAAGIDTDKLSDEQKRLASEVDKARRALDDNNAQLKAAQREQAAAARATAEHGSRVESLKGAMSSGAKQVLAFAAAYVSLNAAMGLVQRGLSLVSQGIRAVAMDGSDKQQALAQLEATLASTGRQAEFTTQQLLDMADAMEASSMLTAEQVQSAQARLLSYTDVAANEFPRALQIVIDQQQRLGISAEQSAEIVGRALQSPSKAMAALGRQGFTLEAGQQRLLKQLEATGRMAEAQSIIMDMLTEAYGGAAAAARMNTFQGLLKGITDRFGDFASRVANSGAFEYMQRKLVDLSDYLDEMANDGRLDSIAQSLSDAFVNGAEAVSEYVKKLAEVDFEGLANRASAMARQIGPAIETTVSTGRAVVATLSTVWNAFSIAVTSTAAVLVKAVQLTGGSVGLAVGQIAGFFGGDEIRQKAEGLYTFLGELSDAYVEQAKTDLGQIGAAWDSAGESAERAGKKTDESWNKVDRSAEKARQAAADMADAMAAAHFKIGSVGHALTAIRFADTEKELRLIKVAVEDAFSRDVINQSGLEQALAAIASRMEAVRAVTGKATDAQREQARAIADLKQKQAELLEQRLRDEISLEDYSNRHNELSEQIRKVSQGVDEAAVSIKSYEEAQKAFSTASSVAQLEAFKKALFDAYSNKDINFEQFQALHNEASVSIRKLEAAAGAAGETTKGLGRELKTLSDVQRAISDAKTDRDIAAVNAALKRMLDTGIIDGAQYNAEMQKSAARLKEIKASLEGAKKAQDDKNKSDQQAIVTSEQLRRESGKRMEAERKAGDEAMQRRRKESSDAQRDMSAMEGFFDGVMNRAREPVAALSRAALEAFDRLRGLTTAAPSIDTSSLDATRTSLESVSKALGDVRAALAMPMQSSLARWMAETQQAGLQTQQAFLSQKASLQSLMRDYERGSLTAQQFVRRANGMKNALSLLDESDLSGLESAIEAANQRMQQMGQSTRSTLESLQDELDGLQGRQDDIERRRFAARQRELQAQLAEAQAGGDAQAVANASRALGLLRQIEAESAQARQAEEQKRRMEAQQATQPAAQQAEQTPSKVIRLEIPGRPAVDVAVSDDAAETNLLSILEQAGLRSL